MLTEVFVVAKSINSLGQIEASVGCLVVALSGPLVESDTVFLCKYAHVLHEIVWRAAQSIGRDRRGIPI